MKHTALAITLALAAAGCSASHASGAQTQTTAQQPAAAQAGGATSTAPADASSPTQSSLPVYPGAAKVTMPRGVGSIPGVCGSKASLTMYEVKNADAATVAKWYDGRISGAIDVDTPVDVGGGSGSTNLVVFEPDGTGMVAVTQMHYGNSTLTKASKLYGIGDKTNIVLETYEPPVPHDVLVLFQQAQSADPSAKQAARDQLKAKCGANGANGN